MAPVVENHHASSVAVGSCGLIITGPSGSGKSTLAIEMIGLGAELVSDDQTVVTALPEGALQLHAPAATQGLIEARGVGILRLPTVTALATAVVDLSQTETERMPQTRETVIAGVTLPLLRKVETPAFASILMAYLRGERHAP